MRAWGDGRGEERVKVKGQSRRLVNICSCLFLDRYSKKIKTLTTYVLYECMSTVDSTNTHTYIILMIEEGSKGLIIIEI